MTADNGDPQPAAAPAPVPPSDGADPSARPGDGAGALTAPANANGGATGPNRLRCLLLLTVHELTRGLPEAEIAPGGLVSNDRDPAGLVG